MKRVLAKFNTPTKIIGGLLGFIVTVFTLYGFTKSMFNENIAGNWNIRFDVKESSYKPYIGESHTQKIFFIQNESNVTGDGEKWMYNDKLLPFEAHRKLEYQGTVDGSNLLAKYILHGEKRVSTGSISVEISDDGKTMTGTFVGTAGDTKGTVTGQKID